MGGECCKVVLAVIFPPFGVCAESGCGCDLLINILLTCLGWLPGVIHAMYLIFGREKHHHYHQGNAA
ncbi:unnamed protein product, partial [Medioppia subpectinata]